jgi:DNA-binding MarR family transcriptional regulator
MLDRYDPRSSNDRDRGDGVDRSRGGRGGGGERDHADDRDPRDVFTKNLDLPRTRERQPVRERDRVYEIDGTESRVLATVGAFRVVAERDLHDGRDDTGKGLRHLEREGLVRTSPLSTDDRAVVLTDRGRDLLEANRHDRQERSWEPRQAFYAGLRKPRELTHDSKVYRAYVRAEERIRDQGGRVKRVVLDYELKRDYQRFLHERNRGRKDCDGCPDREPEEIARWAREHDLPYDDGHVHFPDARIEYEERHGRSRHQDIEVVTGHYRGAHAGAVARSGFNCYRAISGMVGGCASTGRKGGSRHPRLAEELLG